MTKFHISKAGIPAPCRAKEGSCPLGGSESHFKTKNEAQSYADEKHEQEFGLIPDKQETHKTSSGLEYSVSKVNNFKGYDKTVAQTHLNNYGEIYLDSYKKPIDNEYSLEMIEEER